MPDIPPYATPEELISPVHLDVLWEMRLVLDIETVDWKREHFEQLSNDLGEDYTASRDHGLQPGESPEGLAVTAVTDTRSPSDALEEVLARVTKVLGSDHDADLLVQSTITRIWANPLTGKEQQ